MLYSKKNIIISESQIKPLFRSIILEDRESKNIHKARVYLRNNGIDDKQAKLVLDKIRQDIPNARLTQCKFLVGICRYFLKNELDIIGMNSILPFIASDAHVNEYDSDFNGLSFESLYNQFKTIKDKSSEESRKQSYNKTNLKRNPDYKIYKIPSFDDAEKFSNYTNWCVTQSYYAYKKYTNDRIGIFYFCVKNGFESLKEPYYESGNPLDEYGLSMIAISIDSDGDLNTCTSRWNYANGGNDHIMTKDQIEELLGVNFYETFKPRYTKEELERINREKDDKIRNIIKEINQYDRFDDNGYYNYNDTIIQKVVLSNGDIKYIAQIEPNENYFKIFNSDLSLFTNEKFNGVDVLNAKNGIIVYYDDGLFNILLLNGSLLLEHNAYEIRNDKNFICVKMYEYSRYEIYDSTFKKITNETFDDILYTKNENLLIVENDGLCNILSINGSLLFEDYVYIIINYKNFICVKMYENSRYEIYDSTFKKITNETFDYVDESSGFLIIDKNDKCNVMDMHGNIMLNKNYSTIHSIKNYNGYLFFSVQNGDKENVVNRLGQRLFDEYVIRISLNYDYIAYYDKRDERIKISYEEAIKRMH